MEEHPFPDLKVSSSQFLDEVETRQLCSQCSKSRRYFCYTCFIPLPSIAHRLPRVELPFNVHIIKHPHEVSGKSTAAHAAVLAPHSVTVFHFPDIPQYEKSQQTVLVFPGSSSVSLQQYIADNSKSKADSETESSSDTTDVVKTVVFIDSTWYQVYKIATDPRLTCLQRIELSEHETKFWRHQLDKPLTYLSTVEAIYYCAREYYELCTSETYNGQYDDILFFFVYFYHKIQSLTTSTGKRLKAYHGKRRKQPRAIQF